MSFLPIIIWKVPKKDFYTIWSATCFLFLWLQCPLLSHFVVGLGLFVSVCVCVWISHRISLAFDRTWHHCAWPAAALSRSLTLCRRSCIVRGRNVLCITQTNCAWRWQGIPEYDKRRRLGEGESAMAMAIQPKYVDSIRETRTLNVSFCIMCCLLFGALTHTHTDWHWLAHAASNGKRKRFNGLIKPTPQFTLLSQTTKIRCATLARSLCSSAARLLATRTHK